MQIPTFEMVVLFNWTYGYFSFWGGGSLFFLLKVTLILPLSACELHVTTADTKDFLRSFQQAGFRSVVVITFA